jgi:hypothetical protein
VHPESDANSDVLGPQSSGESGEPGGDAPVPKGCYCGRCFYDLRGLRSRRCPECGQPFNPDKPGTYSRTPHSTRVRDFLNSVADVLSDAFGGEDDSQLKGDLHALRVRAASAARETNELRRRVQVLEDCLKRCLDEMMERGVIDAGRREDTWREIERAMDEPLRIEMDEEPPPAETVSPELMELSRLVSEQPHDSTVRREPPS